MKTAYVYPGTFSPPTYGHFNIAWLAAKIFPEVTIICSANPNKKDVWFEPEKCRELWKTYKLPKNVKVMTFSDFLKLGVKGKDIVMIRGLRNGCDYDSEKQVVFFNKEKYGIGKFFYIFGRKKYKKVSSSRARDAASNFDLRTLNKLVSPPVAYALQKRLICE
ncbi:MAG: adenylyltransferase/cytidyltransferase family protein [Parcubacteria group bacterium]